MPVPVATRLVIQALRDESSNLQAGGFGDDRLTELIASALYRVAHRLEQAGSTTPSPAPRDPAPAPAVSEPDLVPHSPDKRLRPALVALGVTMGIHRYAGQHSTEAAHEFADRVLEVLQILGL